ncbi:class I SAM-dependent methyltransferase [Edaphobacter aggregans]|uniref:class I SAM-dependent methyltransferase n=1 Tax=Edaphobacter aggregans TaxID=570835 RepID=UPI00054D6D45|nr:methyltransferase domain-containing protein [Edaphobacter aggregans]
MPWALQIPPRRALISLCLNTGKKVGLSKKVRACHLYSEQGTEYAAKTAIDSFETLRPYLPDLTGLTGLEIGPGDNIGVAECCLANGAAHMICVEQFATVHDLPTMSELIAQRYGPYSSRPKHVQAVFESVDREVDFIYSVDVMEHVASVSDAIRHMAKILKPGGVAVHSVDFAGHNTYAGTGIDFLTCPDWMWKMLHSHLQTTNRIRYGELIDAAKCAGLELVSAVPVITVSDERVGYLRPKMIPRYRALPTEDLKVLQAIVAFRKNGGHI